MRFDAGQCSRCLRLLLIDITRSSSMGKPSASSMAGCTASLNDLVPNSRSVTSADSTMPGTSVDRIPDTGTQFFKPLLSGASSISSGLMV